MYGGGGKTGPVKEIGVYHFGLSDDIRWSHRWLRLFSYLHIVVGVFQTKVSVSAINQTSILIHRQLRYLYVMYRKNKVSVRF